jgi:hypothetical protein
LQEKIKTESGHNEDLKRDLKQIYSSVKDFTVSATVTDKAIKKMNSINLKIKASDRKISKMNLELEKL